MNSVSATMDGSFVNILEVLPNGRDIYIVYMDTSRNLKVTKRVFSNDGTDATIGTTTTVVS